MPRLNGFLTYCITVDASYSQMARIDDTFRQMNSLHRFLRQMDTLDAFLLQVLRSDRTRCQYLAIYC
ncbi:hypothetical protein D3C80_1948170 [compost metagenome]